MTNQPLIIDCLQYSNWSENVFRQMNEGKVAAVHVTICYHEDFRGYLGGIVRVSYGSPAEIVWECRGNAS